jgi:hypothetical protein
MSSPKETPEAAPAGPAQEVARGPIFWLISLALVGFLPGFAAVDVWIGRLDARGQVDADSEYYVLDEQLGWVPCPHFENPEFETVLDSRGMRNPEIPGDAPADEVRIAGFGASRVYGAAGVLQSDTWAARLDREFEGELDAHVRFLNGGVMAYSTVQASRRAIRVLPEIEADLVFVLVSPGAQSMLDPSATRNWVRSGGRLVRRDVIEGWPEALHPLLVGLHELLLHSSLYTRHRSKIALGNEDREQSLQRWMLSRSETGIAAGPMLERTFDELAALGAAAAEQGVELRILVFPEQMQDDPERWEAYCRNNASRGAPSVGTPRSEPTEVLLERCAELGLETWDFTEEVDLLGVDRERLLAGDTRHWSGEGHAVFAEGVARRLRDGLLDELVQRRKQNPRRP